MKFVAVFFLVLSLNAWAGPKTSEPTATKFGGKITLAENTPMNQVMSNYEDYKGKPVAFVATAKKVCESKGCWMVLQDGDKEVRTLFKDYGFFVPKDILGKKVRVQGKMNQKHISAATIRHYMKDEGKKMNEIKKVKTGRVEFEFEADAVEIIKEG